MKIRIFILFLLLQNSNSNAHPSLFFTEKEVNREVQKTKEIGLGTKLTLSAILYFDESHWTIWINDKIIRPENAHELGGYQIENVTPQSVTFITDEQKTFTLHSYQMPTFN